MDDDANDNRRISDVEFVESAMIIWIGIGVPVTTICSFLPWLMRGWVRTIECENKKM